MIETLDHFANAINRLQDGIDLRFSPRRWQTSLLTGRQGLRRKKRIKMSKYGQCFVMGLGEPSEREQLAPASTNISAEISPVYAPFSSKYIFSAPTATLVP